MRLVDTSAWIEWLVPAMVQLELARWPTREVGEDEGDQAIAFTTTCTVIDLDTAIALSAAELGAQHKLATADAIIYAAARAHGAGVLTCDRHFGNLPGVHYIPKPAE